METNEDMNTNQWVEDRLSKLSPDAAWRPDVTRGLASLQEKQRPATRVRWVFGLATALAVCAGSLAFPAPRAVAQRVLAPCVNACESLFLAKAAPAAGTPGQGRPAAADFSLKDAAGSTIRLSDYKGKVVLLNFWATWCAPCKIEIPWFMEFERTHRDRGFAVIGVSMDEDGWRVVKPFLEARQINYRIGVGDDALAQKFGGADGLPLTLMIDRQGRIAARHLGLVGKDEYEKEIAAMLAER